jgi:membrane-bound ClpP family serine protease
VIAGAAIVSLFFFGFIVRKAAGARSRDALKRSQVLVGSIGEAREDLDPEGRIFVTGAIWEAVSTGARIPRGTAVSVIAQKGARLAVEPVRAAEPSPAGPAGDPGLTPARPASSRRRVRQRTG